MKLGPQWWGLALLPFLIPLAVVAGHFARPRKLSASEFAAVMRGYVAWLEGSPNFAIDEFESLRLADCQLESLRQRAVRAGPPAADVQSAREVLREAEQLALERVRS